VCGREVGVHGQAGVVVVVPDEVVEGAVVVVGTGLTADYQKGALEDVHAVQWTGQVKVRGGAAGCVSRERGRGTTGRGCGCRPRWPARTWPRNPFPHILPSCDVVGSVVGWGRGLVQYQPLPRAFPTDYGSWARNVNGHAAVCCAAGATSAVLGGAGLVVVV